jgi:hypothetical protein
MANVCSFRLTITVPKPTLNELKAFLTPAIEECPGGYYGECVLILDKLWPDLDKDSEHQFVGLDHPITQPKVQKTGMHRLTLDGASKWCPPFALLERLTRQYPDLEFRLGATTEHEQHEVWTAKNGKLAAIEMSLDAIREQLVVFFVRDGKRLELPECVDHSGDGYEPDEFTADYLVRLYESMYRSFVPGQSCPGVENGQLLKLAEEFVKGRAERRAALATGINGRSSN